MNGKYVLSYSQPSHWFSCRLITTELLKQYSDYTVWNPLDEIPRDLEELAIPDHRWVPLSVAQSLPATSRVTLHIFGDFTLKLSDFSALFDELKNKKLTLIVGSKAQERMVSSLFPETVSCLRVAGYPFQLSQVSTASDFRTELGIPKEQRLIGYVGRMSRQKGVLNLLEAFLKVQSSLKAKLILCGPVDFHSMWQYSDGADQAARKRFETLLKLAGEQVIWIPFLDRSKLSGLYRSLDLFISPSTFHDEDYGLSVAEAISFGVPSLITAWGGYLEHQHEKLVSYLDPTLGSSGYEVGVETLSSALLGKNSPPVKHQSVTLSAEERGYIIKNPKFLSRDGHFDLELYKKIYASYLLC